MHSWIIVAAAIIYLLLLFAVAHFGDRRQKDDRGPASRPGVYSLSLAVYCTSWTFFGSVGVAARDGLAFLAIYIGPICLFLFAPAFFERIIRLAKAEKITTVADFIGSRYGKSTSVAAIATMIAIVGTVPYIALQLKAISTSVATLVTHYEPSVFDTPPVFGDLALLVAIVLGVFAILFGTRHADATEHQNGLVLAVAMESLVKLAAFLAVGLWVTFQFFEWPELWSQALASEPVQEAFSQGIDGNFVASLLLSTGAIFLLPRQFHMAVVENRTRSEVRRARWLFPLYLVAINIFVVPIAAAGVLKLGHRVDADLYVLALPLSAGPGLLTLFAFVGGLSAATAMVIVASVALSIMISNDLVIPALIKRYGDRPFFGTNETRFILYIRRSAILCIVFLGYVYYRLAGNGSALASIGLLSFAAIAQFAPAFVIGLFWKGANARGAKAGMLAGIAMWLYTLLLPAVLPHDPAVISGPFGILALRPQALFGLDLDPLMHGVLWSVGLNALLLVLGSLSRPALPLERIQAAIFMTRDSHPVPSFRRPRAEVTAGDLRATIARYLGADRTDRSFQSFARDEGRTIDDGMEADSALIRFSEQLLGSAIGSASSRLVLSLLLQRHSSSRRTAIRLLDDASEALQYNRDLLRIALEQVDQGLALFNEDFCLTFWNRQFRDLLDLPVQFGQVGTPLTAVLGQLQAAEEIDAAEFRETFRQLTQSPSLRQIALRRSGRVIEIRANPMPEGGIVATVSDMTERVRRAAALRDMNETLELRVGQRTAELLQANEALAEARRTAEAANIGKTRFLAAAGHDILQPLNAAKLYATALQERLAHVPGTELAANIGSSLESVETILGAVLDISRLDAGGMQPKCEDFALAPLLRQVETDLKPLAAEKGISLRIVHTSATVRSDRNLLRRLVQNLVSNAIKYTPRGKVVVGIRRKRRGLRLEIVDSGIGIPSDKMQSIFHEFIRLDEGSRTARGLGLGLSIVERIARVLDHPIEVASIHGRGTHFRVGLPRGRLQRETPSARAASQPPPAAFRLDGMTALCIDNEAAILDGMATLLTGWGCEVLTADGTSSALAAIGAARRHPDIALVDYHLDGETGLAAIARLRAATDPGLKALLITADRSPELREAAAAANVDVLNKPLKPASLRAAMMAQRRAGREAAE